MLTYFEELSCEPFQKNQISFGKFSIFSIKMHAVEDFFYNTHHLDTLKICKSHVCEMDVDPYFRLRISFIFNVT